MKKPFFIIALLAMVVTLYAQQPGGEPLPPQMHNGLYYYEEVFDCPSLNAQQLIGAINILPKVNADAVKGVLSYSPDANMITLLFSYALERNALKGDILLDVPCYFYAKDGKLKVVITGMLGRVGNLSKGETFYKAEELKVMQQEKGVNQMNLIINTIYNLIENRLNETASGFDF